MSRWIALVLLVGPGLACGDGDANVAADETRGDTSSTGPMAMPTTTSTTTSDASESGTSTAGPATSTADASSSSGGEIACAGLGEVDADALFGHLVALDAIAASSDGHRAVGTIGHDLSVDYVRGELEAMGYETSAHAFDIWYFDYDGAMSLSWPGTADYVEWTDFQVPDYAHFGEVLAPAQPIDVELGEGNASTSGCEPADFADFVPGNIAILQRGTCPPADKILAAQAAGAVGAIVFNQGDSEDRTGTWWVSLGALTDIQIPVLLTTYAIGESMALAPDGAVTIDMDVDVSHEERPTQTVLAESSGSADDEVIVIGAHLDSVKGGPGINDNGTGVAAVLEVARLLHGCETTRRVRFAWWTAEEVGLVGSTQYVEDLAPADRDAIVAYFNLDMVGSPNHAQFRFDGDGSTFGPPGPLGSGAIESVFVEYFTSVDIASDPVAFSQRSDYVAFVAHDIASGGVFTGAEGIKTDAQAEAHGGRAGAAFDGCYHQACDDIDNVDVDVLESNTRALAYALEAYALP